MFPYCHTGQCTAHSDLDLYYVLLVIRSLCVNKFHLILFDLMFISCCCLREQRRVTRLPAPHGDCQYADSVDSTKNAYADFYPVEYTPSVRLLPLDYRRPTKPGLIKIKQ